MKLRTAFLLLSVFSLLIVGLPLAWAGQTSPAPAELAAQRDDCGIDLVMVLDSSGSITPPDYEIMKTFVTDLVESFRIGPDDANISIVQFSSYTRLEIGLSNNMETILEHVRLMPKIDQGTNITAGLELARDQLFTGRSDVPRVIIVLTDGLHNEGPSPIIASANIRGELNESNTQPVTILGVAVGSFKLGELIQIAGGDQNVIQVPNFAGLQLIKSILYDYSCAVVTGQRTTNLPTTEPGLPTVEPAPPQNTPIPPVATTVPAQQATPTEIAQGPAPTIFVTSALGDTTQFAFASDRDGDSEIFSMNGDGTNIQQLTYNEADDDKPAWSKDGTRIAYESDLDGDYDIYVMHADGSNVVNLTNNNSDDWGAAWSPDNSQIAFHSSEDGDIELFVMHADGTNRRQLTVNLIATDRSPEWSPDGSKLIYFSDVSGGRELYVIEVSSGAITRLTNDEYYDGHPDWSPTDNRIVFSSTRVNANSEIFTMNSDGTDLRRLTNFLGLDEDPIWSPDGTQIAFESTQGGNYDIWVMNADGTGLQRLTNSPARDWSVDWSWKSGQN